MTDDMAGDARFEDAEEGPLRLLALDGENLAVISALVQDAVFPVSEMTYVGRRRRFAVLLNRFRWEDRPEADRSRRPYERVRSLLVVEGVLAARTAGFDRRDHGAVLSLLRLAFHPGADGAGRLDLVLSGGGTIALETEALEVTLRDVTRPHLANSGKAPDHG